jgi:hypothetical protein
MVGGGHVERVEEEWEGSQKRRRRVHTENTEEEHREHGEERPKRARCIVPLR